MPWRPGRDGLTCRICGRERAEVGRLSARGKCAGCARERLVAAIVEQRAHSGPMFELWRRRMAASVGGILLEELEEGSLET